MKSQQTNPPTAREKELIKKLRDVKKALKWEEGVTDEYLTTIHKLKARDRHLTLLNVTRFDEDFLPIQTIHLFKN